MMLYKFFVPVSLSVCSFFAPLESTGQEEGSHTEVDTIYQTQVILELTPMQNLKNCKFSVLEEGKLFKEINSNFPSLFLRDLCFGKNYSWQVELFYDSGKKLLGPYSFYTSANSTSDSSQIRFRLVNEHIDSSDYRDGIIVLDYSNVAINRKGEVVWMLNNRQHRAGDRRVAQEMRSRIRPLMLTKQGTIVFTSPKGAYETKLDGTVLWQANSNISVLPDTPMFFHHDIISLSNGNKMTIGKYRQKRLLKAVSTDSVEIEFDAIFEFNKENEMIWWWGLGHKLDERDIAAAYNLRKRGNDSRLPIGEINSIFLDENKEQLYVGIKDLNTILKINHKNGKIICNYGDKLYSSSLNYGKGFFKYQHGGVPDSAGNLVIFNNNGELEKDKATEIVVISQPQGKDSSKILWKFSCDIDSLTPAKTARLGYALPLSNRNILVCMGFAGRLFEVNPGKEIVWDCIVQEKKPRTEEWVLSPNYRAYYYPHLYPNAFSAVHRYDSGRTSIKIKNLGWQDDTYIIYSEGRRGREVIAARVELKAGKEIEIPLHTRSVRKKPLLFIRSQNSGIEKNIEFKL